MIAAILNYVIYFRFQDFLEELCSFCLRAKLCWSRTISNDVAASYLNSRGRYLTSWIYKLQLPRCLLKFSETELLFTISSVPYTASFCLRLCCVLFFSQNRLRRSKLHIFTSRIRLRDYTCMRRRKTISQYLQLHSWTHNSPATPITKFTKHNYYYAKNTPFVVIIMFSGVMRFGCFDQVSITSLFEKFEGFVPLSSSGKMKEPIGHTRSHQNTSFAVLCFIVKRFDLCASKKHKQTGIFLYQHIAEP